MDSTYPNNFTYIAAPSKGRQWNTLRDGYLTPCNLTIWHPLGMEKNTDDMEHQSPISYMGVSLNSFPPKSSILIGFSIINRPFWGTTIFGNTQMASLPSNFRWGCPDPRFSSHVGESIPSVEIWSATFAPKKLGQGTKILNNP